MRLEKRVKNLFRYVGLRSQSLADPTLSYGVACRGEEPHWVRPLGCDFTLLIDCRPRVSVPGRCEGCGQRGGAAGRERAAKPGAGARPG
jgi:hypothetical protein